MPLPQKKYFRQRAHSNPFSDHDLAYPVHPDAMDWAALYPRAPADARVEFADVGCGYGGLLVALSPLFPETLMLGMEIRVKVCEYVSRRIDALRASAVHWDDAGDDEPPAVRPRLASPHARPSGSGDAHLSESAQNGNQPGCASVLHSESRLSSAGGALPPYGNIAVVRANAMKFLPCYFARGQLQRMFFLFPDPHFKKKKHKARIISPTLLAEYAYVLAPGTGLLYTATDVPALHAWMVGHLDGHALFARVPDAELADDAVVRCVLSATEEGKKVARNNGPKLFAVYRRLPDA